jgi:hypothetical protein
MSPTSVVSGHTEARERYHAWAGLSLTGAFQIWTRPEREKLIFAPSSTRRRQGLQGPRSTGALNLCTGIRLIDLSVINQGMLRIWSPAAAGTRPKENLPRRPEATRLMNLPG